MGISACTQTAIIDCYFLRLHRQVMEKDIEIRGKCKHFRILIIGRGNAGKNDDSKEGLQLYRWPNLKPEVIDEPKQ
jgi:hypothetical protein